MYFLLLTVLHIPLVFTKTLQVMLSVKSPLRAEAVPPWSQVQVCAFQSAAPSSVPGTQETLRK